MLSAMDKMLLEAVADLHEIPQGAYNIRRNGEAVSKNSTNNITISSKKERPGIDVEVKAGTRNESIHIPVILTSDEINDVVYNTFHIGENSDVYVVAGCGIHNPGKGKSQHDGVHDFRVGRNSKMKYMEKHFAEGDRSREKILNPATRIEIEEGGFVELDLMQIKGIDSSKRKTTVILHDNARLDVTERILTDGMQSVESSVVVEMTGSNCSAQIRSRTIARDRSVQVFYFDLVGRNRCRGHIQCDSIIMDSANVQSVPKISALHNEAQLIHEAAIGRIESEQMTKLMTLGMTEKEAEETILAGFLK